MSEAFIVWAREFAEKNRFRTIASPKIIGSIFGMLLMSGLIGLPFAISARRLSGVNYGLQTTAGALSIAFGLWYAYQVGTANGFWS